MKFQSAILQHQKPKITFGQIKNSHVYAIKIEPKSNVYSGNKAYITVELLLQIWKKLFCDPTQN